MTDEALLELARLAKCNRELAENTAAISGALAKLSNTVHAVVEALAARVATLEARLDARDEAWLAQKPLKLRGVRCDHCSGTGHDDAMGGACRRCGGTGEIM